MALMCAFSDFYPKHIMNCSSKFNDPSDWSPKELEMMRKSNRTIEFKTRQRNLQHSVEFFPLQPNDTVVFLDSGEYAACGFM